MKTNFALKQKIPCRLLRSLAKNQSLTWLDAKGNKIGVRTWQRVKEMLYRNRTNMTGFLNEVSTLGQGIPCNGSHQQSKLPAEVNCIIVSKLATAHGLFGSRQLKRQVLDNLFPKEKYSSSEEKGPYCLYSVGNAPDYIPNILGFENS